MFKQMKEKIAKSLALLLCILLTGCGVTDSDEAYEVASVKNEVTTQNLDVEDEIAEQIITVENVQAEELDDYVEINNNIPLFEEETITTASYEMYSDLDSLGRCGTAEACIGQELMPTEERGTIGQIKPSGWHTVKYTGVIDGNYLYNRCHLIAYQLSGENANEKNLLTGTRQFNVEGMLPFENMIANYVNDTNYHVMYRVTPVFEGDNLVAAGVQMEAYSVEDQGEGICFNVFVYNVQNQISIDYATGESCLVEDDFSANDTIENEQSEGQYAVNSKNGKIHMVGNCSATGDGEQAMDAPVYFRNYEEALEYSEKIVSDLEKRNCGNCW